MEPTTPRSGPDDQSGHETPTDPKRARRFAEHLSGHHRHEGPHRRFGRRRDAENRPGQDGQDDERSGHHGRPDRGGAGRHWTGRHGGRPDEGSHGAGHGHWHPFMGAGGPGPDHRRAAFARALARGFGPGGPDAGGPGRGWGGPRGGRGGRHGFGGHGGHDGLGFGPGFGQGGPGGRRGERFFERGELRYVILDLVNDEPRHGYDIIRALEEQFSGLYSPSPGTIYPTLSLLEDQGFVVSEALGGKKVFRATDAGRAELARQGDTLQSIRDRIGARPVFEAIGDIRPIVGELWDLGQTVMRAASRGDLADEDRIHRLRETIRRARAEIDVILTVPAGRHEAKADPTGDGPVIS